LAQELIPRQEYEMLLGALKERIRSAQLEALRSVNREQISLYTDIGRMIVERQQGDSWGKGIHTQAGWEAEAVRDTNNPGSGCADGSNVGA
jgi:hypothetical protein